MDEFDVNDPTVHGRAEASALARLRRDDPVHWDERNGWWLITKHSDVKWISRQPERFSSEPMGPWHAFTSRFSMQAQDGQAHHLTRNVVSRGFTPRATVHLEDLVRRYADEAIDAVIERGRCDLVQDIAVPVPMRIIADMLGIATKFDLFKSWVDAVTGTMNQGALRSPEAEATAAEFEAYVREVVAARTAEPRDDLISTLLAHRDEGVFESFARDPFPGVPPGDGVLGFISFLVLAGSETTRHAISQGTQALLGHPDQLERLISDPGLLRSATEEILRFVTPVRAMQRVVMRDVELRGRKLSRGQRVVMIYPSANRDEDVFDEPQRFQIDRRPNDHISFGFGSHFCLGANLARMEIRVTLDRLLARLSELRLAPGSEPVRFQSTVVNGLEHMDVEFAKPA